MKNRSERKYLRESKVTQCSLGRFWTDDTAVSYMVQDCQENKTRHALHFWTDQQIEQTTAKKGRRSCQAVKWLKYERTDGCSEGVMKWFMWRRNDGKLYSHTWTAGPGWFPLDLFTKSFQQADLAVSCSFIELCADSPGLGSPCKHLCSTSKGEEGRNLPRTPQTQCGPWLNTSLKWPNTWTSRWMSTLECCLQPGHLLWSKSSGSKFKLFLFVSHDIM